MADTLSFSPLSLSLPSSRMSVDFSSFATHAKPRNANLRTNKAHPPLPIPNAVPRRAIARPLPLPEVQEESEQFSKANPRQAPRNWSAWIKPQPTRFKQSDPPVDPLSRASSSASTASTNSTASTAVSSVFSRADSVSTVRTAHSSLQYSETLVESCVEDAPTLASIPLSLLEHILSYALCLPLTVSIGPQDAGNRHMQYRYHRAGLDYMDIQLILKHPVFMVSHQIREIALDVFHRKCDFVIDLHRIYHTKVSSTINENLKKHQKFWVNEPPRMVRDSLRRLSKLQLRLPVASSETNGHRGRHEDDWMDGSDGKGGGGWKIKSMKREQEDAAAVHKCLEAIKTLVMCEPSQENDARTGARRLSRMGSFRRKQSKSRERQDSAQENDTRSRSRSLSRMGSLRRLGSKSRERKSQERIGSSLDVEENKERTLKRLEIVLVKRNPYVMVLPETLGLIRALRSVPVTGFTKYFFELEGQKVGWATKYRKRWQGFEPDGPRLLGDLQGLTIAESAIEPIRTPTEFKFVNVSKGGRLQLSDTAIPKTPIVLERPKTAEKDIPDLPPLPSNGSPRRKPLAWTWKKPHKRKDSFGFVIEQGMDELGSSGTTTSGRNNPPSVDELKKIAEDIKNGLY